MAGDSKPGVMRLFKYSYSSALLVFSIVLIIGNMFKLQTRLASQTHPAVALVLMLIAIVWLTMVEGGQGALVGLGPVDSELYRESHPMSHRCVQLVYRGDNLNRYLLGRQFMVILIVFIVELCGATHGHNGEAVALWGLPSWIITIFLTSGAAMILFTCMVGQLNSEIIGCHYMLDYRKLLPCTSYRPHSMYFVHITCPHSSLLLLNYCYYFFSNTYTQSTAGSL